MFKFVIGEMLGKVQLKNVIVNAICLDEDQNLWLSLGSGTAVYDGKEWEYISLPEKLYPKALGSIVLFKGKVWANGRDCVMHYDNGRWNIAESNVELGGRLQVSQNGTLWMNSSKGVWFSRDGYEWKKLPLPEEIGFVSAFYIATDNNLCVAELNNTASKSFIYTWNGIYWEPILPPKSGAFKRLLYLIAKNDSDIWVGTESNGLWKYFNGHWTHFSSKQGKEDQGLPGNWILSLQEDKDQRIWSATQNGFGCFTGNSWHFVMFFLTQVDCDQQLKAYNITPTATYLDRDGKLWMISGTGELAWIDTNSRLHDRENFTVMDMNDNKTIVINGY